MNPSNESNITGEFPRQSQQTTAYAGDKPRLSLPITPAEQIRQDSVTSLVTKAAECSQLAPITPHAAPGDALGNYTGMVFKPCETTPDGPQTAPESPEEAERRRAHRLELRAVRATSHRIVRWGVSNHWADADSAETAAEFCDTLGEHDHAAELRSDAAERPRWLSSQAKNRHRQRFTICGKAVPQNAETAQVIYNHGNARAALVGVTTCDSPQCVVCGQVRAEIDVRQIRAMMTEATAQGYSYGMITPTLSHGPQDTLETSLGTLNDALRAMRQQRAYGEVAKRYGIVGSQNFLEVTHGENGYHPHWHMVTFYDPRRAARTRRAEADTAYRRAQDAQSVAERRAGRVAELAKQGRRDRRANRRACVAAIRACGARHRLNQLVAAAERAEMDAAAIPAPALLRRADAAERRAQDADARAAERRVDADVHDANAYRYRRVERMAVGGGFPQDAAHAAELAAKAEAAAERSRRAADRLVKAADELRTEAASLRTDAEHAPAAVGLGAADRDEEAADRVSRARADAADIKAELYPLYAAQVAKRGGTTSFEHGLHVGSAGTAEQRLAEYVAKFGRLPQDADGKGGTADEAARGRGKTGRRGGRTMIDVLRDAEAAERAMIYADTDAEREAAERGYWSEAKVWWGFYAATKGRNFITGRAQVAMLLGVDAEALRAEVVEEMAAEAAVERGRMEQVAELTQDDLNLLTWAEAVPTMLDRVEYAADPVARAQVVAVLLADLRNAQDAEREKLAELRARPPDDELAAEEDAERIRLARRFGLTGRLITWKD